MSSAGEALSLISNAQGWVMFDNMTAAAMAMGAPIASIDQVVSIVLPTWEAEIKLMIDAEFLAKGWIPVGGPP